MKISVIIFLCFGINLLPSQTVSRATLYGQWSDPSLVASSEHKNVYNEVYSIYNEKGEYAVIGSTAGTHIIDVTNPKQPKQIHFVKGKATGTQIIHRDFKKYKNFLFGVCDEGQSSLQIIDYSGLPDSIHVVYDSDSILRTTHNIFIDTAQARLYACYTRNMQGFSALRVLDIAEPARPKLMNKYNNIDGFELSDGGVHDAYVKDHLAFLNAGRGLAVVDFTDVNDPALLTGILDYPDAGYNHSGWLSDEGDHYYMADETHGYDLKAFDVSDLPDIRLTSTFNADSPSNFSIVHNPYVRGDYLYAAYYFNGLQVFDIKDRGNPKRILEYPTSTIPVTNSIYRGAWGVNPDLSSGLILVSDMQNGLFVFEPVEQTLTSTINEAINDIQIYPNPVSDYLMINGDQPFNEEAVVLDNSGKEIKVNVVNNRVDVSQLSIGSYVLKLNNKSSKFIKVK